jgi:hypothetical protein
MAVDIAVVRRSAVRRRDMKYPTRRAITIKATELRKLSVGMGCRPFLFGAAVSGLKYSSRVAAA